MKLDLEGLEQVQFVQRMSISRVSPQFEASDYFPRDIFLAIACR